MALKYKVGDRVRIKNLDWYNENKDIYDEVWCAKGTIPFNFQMKQHCGKVMTISWVCEDCYTMVEDLENYYCDEMIEGLVKDECPQDFIEKYCISCGTQRCVRTKEYLNGCPYYNAYMCIKQNNAVEEEYKLEPKFKVGDILFYRGETCGYLKVEEIRVENGEIRYYETSRNIYLVENDPDVFADKVCSVETEETKNNNDMEEKETLLGWVKESDNLRLVPHKDYEIKQDGEKFYLVKKKKEYPKTYEECLKIIGIKLSDCYIQGYKSPLLEDLQELLICRDAYWKLYGEEMGLGKPWEPDWKVYDKKYVIGIHEDMIYQDTETRNNKILAFPTEEMRDAFYENFKEEIEICKELL